jgi:hypothetical protein
MVNNVDRNLKFMCRHSVIFLSDLLSIYTLDPRYDFLNFHLF